MYPETKSTLATGEIVADEFRAPVAMLQSAIDRAQRSAQVDWTKVTQELFELRHVLDQIQGLARSDQPAEMQPPADDEQSAFDLSAMLHQAVCAVSPMARALVRTVEVELPGGCMLAGSPADLREPIICLLRHALGGGRLSLVVRVVERGNRATSAVIEILNESLDVPDALRRQLSTATSAHRGETHFVTEPAGFRVRLVLPLAPHQSVVTSGPLSH
jgi:hypothetical protein